jgi:hypothetical protein
MSHAETMTNELRRYCRAQPRHTGGTTRFLAGANTPMGLIERALFEEVASERSSSSSPRLDSLGEGTSLGPEARIAAIGRRSRGGEEAGTCAEALPPEGVREAVPASPSPREVLLRRMPPRGEALAAVEGSAPLPRDRGRQGEAQGSVPAEPGAAPEAARGEAGAGSRGSSQEALARIFFLRSSWVLRALRARPPLPALEVLLLLMPQGVTTGRAPGHRNPPQTLSRGSG